MLGILASAIIPLEGHGWRGIMAMKAICSQSKLAPQEKRTAAQGMDITHAFSALYRPAGLDRVFHFIHIFQILRLPAAAPTAPGVPRML